MKLLVYLIFWFLLYICHFYYSYGFTGEIFPYLLPNDCSAEEFYSVNTLHCHVCPKDKNLIPSEDKYTCICNNRSKLIKWDTEFPICSSCKEKQEPTFDKADCIQCPFISMTNNTVCSFYGISPCRTNEILADRDIRGNILERKMCIPCTNGYIPHRNGPFCTPCSLPNCTCPNDTHELLSAEMCVSRAELSSLPDEQSVYVVDFDSGHQVIKSHYLKTHLRTLLYKCTKLKRRRACQSVANMCVMLLYKDEQVAGPCRIFKDYRYVPSSSTSANYLPWLYYSEGDASILLNRKKIDMHYSLDPKNSDSVLNFTLVKYSLEGDFLGLSSIKGNEIQLCPGGISTYKDSAFRFGARYKHSCTLSASDFLNIVPSAIFYDLYLQYYDKSKSVLYAVPLVIRNISHNFEYPNKGSDVSQWLLVRRFFLLDNISGVAYSHEKYKVVSDLSPSVVRYLKSAKLVIKTRREKEDEGKIYPPFLILEYGELTKEDIATDALVEVSFSVDYYMDNDISHIIDVSIGVLSAGVVIWSGIQTWSFCRRSGQLIIDMSTLMELALRSCGYFSNMIFIVSSIVALHTLLFYKAQSVAYIMLPSENLENNVAKYIIFAFSLKAVEIVRLIYMQMKIDIFLIDWERPRACSVITNPNEINQQQPVSIWRTYFVANEWNEIQTKRKTSLLLQLMLTLLLLKVYGVENWAQADPDFHLQHVAYRPESLLLRFAVILTVYMFVYICQWLLVVGVYERYIKNCIQEFVDVCSMANVSVFILLQRNFGYYIHGRSAHGFADTDMQTILTQLRREEDDLVGHRGLLPGTEQQTFQIIIPTALRVYYNKVMSPLNLMYRSQGRSSFQMKAMNNDDAGRIVEAYNNMNKFLAAFLDHALKDLDYEVREKLFVEQLLDIEFHDSLDRGVFYIDNGHSFDSVLFYGNEGTLFTFDVMLFLCMDSFFENTLLSAILCLFVTQIIIWIRNVGGRKNLAKKTLVDDRFLI